MTRLELSDDGRSLGRVVSWKRVDVGGAVAGAKLDEEILWEWREGGGGIAPESERRRTVPSRRARDGGPLPRRSQPRARSS